MKRLKIWLVLFLGLCLPVFNLEAGPEPTLRVAVVVSAPRIKTAVHSPYQILDLATNQSLRQEGFLWTTILSPGQDGIILGKTALKTYGFRIQPRKNGAIYLNGRQFNGVVDIIQKPDKTLLAINRLDREDYVAGVLYNEVAPWWPMEALKAQAIVARAYGLYQAKVNAKKEYDFVCGSYSQAFGRRATEKGRIARAVKLTENQVLTYKDKLFLAFYHAACAGHTTNAASLWKINLPPLAGRECQFCQRSPYSRWQARLSLRQIEQALNKAGVKVGEIKSVRIVDRDISGRITDLEIISASGSTRINANRFRLAVGPNLIKSANFQLKMNKKAISFQGRGFGHGVGMCQWGAFFMARRAFSAEQILGYYYPQARIKNIEELKNAQGDIETF